MEACHLLFFAGVRCLLPRLLFFSNVDHGKSTFGYRIIFTRAEGNSSWLLEPANKSSRRISAQLKRCLVCLSQFPHYSDAVDLTGLYRLFPRSKTTKS
ncbi:hypothetical protein BDW72DRAFT_28308 [Aspergillus terricola var. indicus]